MAASIGLSSAQARHLAARWGSNEFQLRHQRPAWKRLLQRLRNPLVLVLLGASFVSALTGEVASCVIIVSMVALSVAIDFIQEARADRSAQALNRRVQLHATVMRDGKAVRLPVRHLVPGDIVLLAPGSLVPADGRLIEANQLHLNEALLTGEAFPVEKRPSPTLGEEAADLLMGTSVVSGSATMCVVRIGAATEAGKIARELAAEPPPSSFELATRQFGALIMRLTAFMVLFVLLVNAALERPLLESFLFAVALAVGLTPELLPMIVTVTLAHGALRLGRKHVVVKRLAAIEGLGSMEVLCTDKTGTLTRAHVELDRSVDLFGAACERARELAWLNSHFSGGIRTPLDEALLRGAAPQALNWRKVGEVPFDFERRRVSVLLEDGARRMLVVKGAPEAVLALCGHYEAAPTGKPLVLDAPARSSAAHQLRTLGDQGLRVLAVAFREPDAAEKAPMEEGNLALAGFVAFLDPPKPGAEKALAALAASGVRLKILTGDEESVTRHLCAQVGLAVEGILDGGTIARLDDPALSARLESTTIFCRVNPMQKSRVVRLLRARGHVTGFLGDGINDAPALKAADVGLSVSNAVDVAQEAAQLILLRRDLGVIHEGVLEGRRTFVNIRKYLLMGTSSNFGNMFSMAGAALVLPFLPMLPTQVLLNNFLYDVSEIPIPLDHADEAEMRAPQRWDLTLIERFMWTMGPVSSLFDFLTFWVLLSVLEADETLFRTGWFIESLATQVLVIFVIRTRASPFASRPSLALVATSLAVVATAVALPFTPLAAPLGFAAPPPAFFAVLALLALSYLALAEGMKRHFYRHLKPA